MLVTAPATPAVLVLTGPDAGSIRHPDGTCTDLTAAAPRIIDGTTDDLRRAAAILRAKAWRLSASSSMRARAEADRLDAIAATRNTRTT